MLLLSITFVAGADICTAIDLKLPSGVLVTNLQLHQQRHKVDSETKY